MRVRAVSRRGALGLLRVGGGLAAVAAVALIVVGSASSAQFGVTVLKDCITPINVGAPYACEFELSNTVQDSHNTVTVKSLTDVVFRSGGTSLSTIDINS